MQLAGRTFIISGGGSGLGAACAREFAQGGANVVIADINAAAAEAVAREIGASAKSVATDVTKEDGAAAAVGLAVEEFGALDGAITCAGIATAQRAVGKNGALPLGDFSKVIAVNLIGTFNIIRLAAQVMMRKSAGPDEERGVIVCTASVAAFDGQIGQVAYSASKAGVAGMTLPLAREFAQHGIRVMTIAPGIFDTPMLAGLPEAVRRSLGQQVPFPRGLAGQKSMRRSPGTLWKIRCSMGKSSG